MIRGVVCRCLVEGLDDGQASDVADFALALELIARVRHVVAHEGVRHHAEQPSPRVVNLGRHLGGIDALAVVQPLVVGNQHHVLRLQPKLLGHLVLSAAVEVFGSDGVEHHDGRVAVRALAQLVRPVLECLGDAVDVVLGIEMGGQNRHPRSLDGSNGVLLLDARRCIDDEGVGRLLQRSYYLLHLLVVDLDALGVGQYVGFRQGVDRHELHQLILRRLELVVQYQLHHLLCEQCVGAVEFDAVTTTERRVAGVVVEAQAHQVDEPREVEVEPARRCGLAGTTLEGGRDDDASHPLANGVDVLDVEHGLAHVVAHKARRWPLDPLAVVQPQCGVEEPVEAGPTERLGAGSHHPWGCGLLLLLLTLGLGRLRLLRLRLVDRRIALVASGDGAASADHVGVSSW